MFSSTLVMDVFSWLLSLIVSIILFNNELLVSSPIMIPEEIITGMKKTERTKLLPMNSWFKINATNMLKIIIAGTIKTMRRISSVNNLLNSGSIKRTRLIFSRPINSILKPRLTISMLTLLKTIQSDWIIGKSIKKTNPIRKGRININPEKAFLPSFVINNLSFLHTKYLTGNFIVSP